MEEFMWKILAFVATSALSALIAFIKAKSKYAKESKIHREEELEMIKEICKYNLFAMLKEAHKHYVEENGYCTIESKQEVEHMYVLYHDGLHGNGTGTQMYEEIMALPSTDDYDYL